MTPHNLGSAKYNPLPQISYFLGHPSRQFVVISSFFTLSLLILLTQGCGVKSAMINNLSLTASTQALAPSQSVTIVVHGNDVANIPIDLTLSCNNSFCGALEHDQYTAPANVTELLSVTIKAVNAYYPKQSASITLQIYPSPTITSVTPDYVIAGTSSQLAISGSGFAPGTDVYVSEPGNSAEASVSDITLSTTGTIAATITVSPNASGQFSVTVKSPLSSIQKAQSQSIYIYPSELAANPSLPILNVSAYHASGSSAIYSCSGDADAYTIVCSGDKTDFMPGEGIRIVGAGNNPAVPAVSDITITKHGDMPKGTHTYCYMVFAADAAGGITPGSAPSCVSQEPATLSYSGTYNTFSSPYGIPNAVFLWYRSEDYGPYELFTVNGSMDVGQQPSSFGGWPETLPSDSEDISKREDLFAQIVSVKGDQITLSRALSATVEGAMVDHDDSAAIQNAINAASDMGGAQIFLPAGHYNVRRPQFETAPNAPGPYFSYTTDYDYNKIYAWSRWCFLAIPNGSRGNIHFFGSGPSTVIQMPPNNGQNASLLSFDLFTHPGFSPFKAYGIEPVSQGAKTLTLTSNPPPSITPGSDIWIYGGTFDVSNTQPCIDANGTAGGNCHNSEINTVVSVNGRTLQLQYPTSKEYYDDGYDSFGVVPLPTCVHNISLSDMTINANNRLIGVGILYGLLVNHVTVNGRVAGGVFGGLPKRDIVIENSSWKIGEGDVSWLGTSEYDQAVGVALLHDQITGFAAPGAEGPSMGARLYFTEGTSDVYLLNNVFDHISVYTQESTDDYIENNTFHDANIAVGYSYTPNNYPHNQGYIDNWAFLSFGPQKRANISGNIFIEDAGFTPPWVIQVGDYQNAVISDNTISAAGRTGGGAAIMAYSGLVKGNSMTLGHAIDSTVGILAVPDFGPGVPFSSLDIQDNSVGMNGSSAPLGIGVVGPDVLDPDQVCIAANQVNVGKGSQLYIWNQNNILLGCS